MSFKRVFTNVTGYWIYKIKNLPIGVDLFHDIKVRLQYPSVKLVFDVGANEGQTVNWIKHYLPEAAIYSFEPVKKTFDLLCTQTKKYKDCNVFKLALGDKEETTEISLFEDMSVLNSLNPRLMNRDDQAQRELIEVQRLDQFCNRHHVHQIDILKIDTEGFELNVLIGSGDFIQKGKIKFIYCEVGFQSTNVRNTSFSDVSRFLEQHDYFFYAMYQLDSHDWERGNHLGNALFVHRSIWPRVES